MTWCWLGLSLLLKYKKKDKRDQFTPNFIMNHIPRWCADFIVMIVSACSNFLILTIMTLNHLFRMCNYHDNAPLFKCFTATATYWLSLSDVLGNLCNNIQIHLHCFHRLPMHFIANVSLISSVTCKVVCTWDVGAFSHVDMLTLKEICHSRGLW